MNDGAEEEERNWRPRNRNLIVKSKRKFTPLAPRIPVSLLLNDQLHVPSEKTNAMMAKIYLYNQIMDLGLPEFADLLLENMCFASVQRRGQRGARFHFNCGHDYLPKNHVSYVVNVNRYTGFIASIIEQKTVYNKIPAKAVVSWTRGLPPGLGNIVCYDLYQEGAVRYRTARFSMEAYAREAAAAAEDSEPDEFREIEDEEQQQQAQGGPGMLLIPIDFGEIGRILPEGVNADDEEEMTNAVRAFIERMNQPGGILANFIARLHEEDLRYGDAYCNVVFEGIGGAPGGDFRPCTEDWDLVEHTLYRPGVFVVHTMDRQGDRCYEDYYMVFIHRDEAHDNRIFYRFVTLLTTRDQSYTLTKDWRLHMTQYCKKRVVYRSEVPYRYAEGRGDTVVLGFGGYNTPSIEKRHDEHTEVLGFPRLLESVYRRVSNKSVICDL